MLAVSHKIWGKKRNLLSKVIPDGDLILEKILEENPEEIGPWSALGYHYVSRLDEESAVMAWNNAGFSAEDLIIKGNVKRKENDFENALKWFRIATMLDPSSGDAHYYLGWMYAKTDREASARKTFLNALSLKLELFGKSDLLYQIGKLGPAKDTEEYNDMALNFINMAILEDQFSSRFQAVDSHFHLGLLFRQKGWNEKAENEFLYVINEMPDHYPAYVRLGYIAWDVKNDLSTSEQYFFDAMNVNDTKTPAYIGLAYVYGEAGEVENARNTYLHLLELDPGNEIALEGIDKLDDH